MPQMQPEEIIRSIIELEARLQEEVTQEEQKAAAWLAGRRATLEADFERELRNITEGLSRAGQRRLEEARAQAARIETEAAREEARLDAIPDATLKPLVARVLGTALLPE